MSNHARRTPWLLYITAALVAVILSPAIFAADDPLEWIKSPEAYFATPEEKAEWKAKVTSPADAERFIAEYRRRRGEQFTRDFRTRLEYIDKTFAFGEMPGSKTQRGRVYMLLGPPSEQRQGRGYVDSSRAFGTLTQNVEDAAVVRVEWNYLKDRLPKELGRERVNVIFQVNDLRHVDTIENIGVIEPYLSAAAAYVSGKYIADQAAREQQRAATAPPAPQSAQPDPLWNTEAALNGALFHGDSFVSPREEPFYAYSFFVPASVASFKEWNNVLLVTLVRDANGAQVIATRDAAELKAYDDAGNRYLDHSVALPAGKYEGLFAIYTPDGSSMLASNRSSFTVAPASEPRATSLFLTNRIDTLETQDAFDPFTFVAQKYAVRGDGRFRDSEKIGFFAVIANPTGSPSPQLMQRMTLRKDGKEFAKTPLELVPVTQTGPNTFLIATLFDPGTFATGHYALEVQVRDMNAPKESAANAKGYVLATEFDVVK